MDNENLDKFSKYLEQLNPDKTIINYLLSSMEHDKEVEIYNKIKEIVSESKIRMYNIGWNFVVRDNFPNISYVLFLSDESYDYLLKIDKEMKQKYIVMINGDYIYNIINLFNMEELETRYKYLPFIINEIKQNKNYNMRIKKYNEENILNNIYLVNEDNLMNKNITVADLLSAFDKFMQEKNLDLSNN